MSNERNWTAEQIATMRRLRAEGLTYHQIAVRMGAAQATVRRVILLAEEEDTSDAPS